MGATAGSAAAVDAVPPGFTRVTPVDSPIARVTPKVTPAQAAPSPPTTADAPPSPSVLTGDEVASAGEAERVSSSNGAEPAESQTQLTKAQRADRAIALARNQAAKNKRLVAEKQGLAETARRQAEHTAALEQRAAQLETHLSGITRDPIATLKALGYKAEDLARAVAMEGSPEAKIAAVEAELRATQRRLDEQTNQARAAQAATERDQTEAAFKQEASNGEKYPELAQVNSDLVLSMTRQLVVEIRRAAIRRGAVPQGDEKAMARYMAEFSNHDLLSYLEKSYKKKVAPKDKTTPVPTESPKGITKTITNRLTSTRAAMPTDFSKLSDRQQRKVMAQQLRDAGVGK
jgi:hypothetical protein